MKQSSYSEQCIRFNCTFALIVILSQFLVVPCSAFQAIRLPLTRFKSLVSLEKNFGSPDRQRTSLRIVERDLNLDNMKNNLNGLSDAGYYIDVNVGSPPQTMQVLIDTGSANFAIAADHDPNLPKFYHREKSSTYVEDGTETYVPYTEGEWRGVLGQDIVNIPSMPNVTIVANIAFITSASNFFIENGHWQGILGLAYSELSRPDSSLAPFWDSLVSQHPDVPNVFSLQLCGSSFFHTRDKPLMEGSLIIGGVLPALSKSPLFYTPIYKQWFYEVIISDIVVGGTSLHMPCKEYNFDKTIVDSGTTLVRLPTTVFRALVNAVHTAVAESESYPGQPPSNLFYTGGEMMCFPDMALPFKAFPVVSISLVESENTSFTLHLTPQHYLRPIEAVEGSLLVPDETCVKFGFAPSTTGAVLGAVLMEAFYVVFDRNASRIGFGQTTCPLPDPNHSIMDITIEGPLASRENLTECAYKKPESSEQTFLAVTYIITAMSLVLLLPVALVFVLWLKRTCDRRRDYSRQNGSDTHLVSSE